MGPWSVQHHPEHDTHVGPRGGAPHVVGPQGLERRRSSGEAARRQEGLGHGVGARVVGPQGLEPCPPD